MITALIAAAVWTPLSVVVCLALHRARQAQTPTPDPLLPPDGDYPTVEMAAIPPVPLPAWDDFDEVMFRWFAEGSAR